jgi:succinoglycan biosynthesis protein ExoV
MRLYYWRGHNTTNFGDELNALLWPTLLPDFFDDDASELFLGIGSVLDSRHPPGARKTVAGAGYGGYQPPTALDNNWTVHWVRGPHTARRLRLPAACGFGDPASLIDRALATEMLGAGYDLGGCGQRRSGFMPHFQSAERGAWQRAADRAGLTFIDPRDDPRAVLAAIARCSLLVSEALHGVIVADALRVPWVAVAPFAPIHLAKWRDWAAAMSLVLGFERLRASSFAEQLHLNRLAERHRLRAFLERHERLLHSVAADRFADRAAAGVRSAAGATPRLTDDRALARSRDCMQAALEGIRQQTRHAVQA